MAGTATKLHVLDCGSMSCDLTWLLLKPGRSIRPRAERDKPVEWYPCTTHAVVVATPEATMLWDTSCPRDWEERWVPTGPHEFFPYDRVTEEWYASVEKLRGIAEQTNANVIFGHDAEQLWSLRRSPDGYYT
jgi:N-acyl homoserine lactone hydrolase